MPENRVILVTGAAGYWGGRVAERLLAEERYHVIGLDAEFPDREIRGLDFIQADVRNPLLAELLHSEAVDTVCHLAFIHSTGRSERAFDANVMGTSNALGACAEAGVRKVVLKSSMMVYGARATNSAFLVEDHPLRGSRRYGYTRDLVEIETYCNGFFPGAPEIVLRILRFPSIVGPSADTPMTRFLKNRWTPSLMGFNPMMQIIHEDDVVAAVVHAVSGDAPGAFNVAAEDVLPLSRIRGLAGKRPLPVFHSLAYWGTGFGGTRGFIPIEPDYLRYPWVGDLARMRDTLCFEPLHTAEETLREIAGRIRLERYNPGSAHVVRAEERLHDIIEHRRRARERSTLDTNSDETGADHGQ